MFWSILLLVTVVEIEIGYAMMLVLTRRRIGIVTATRRSIYA